MKAPKRPVDWNDWFETVVVTLVGFLLIAGIMYSGQSRRSFVEVYLSVVFSFGSGIVAIVVTILMFIRIGHHLSPNATWPGYFGYLLGIFVIGPLAGGAGWWLAKAAGLVR